jgi:two-component system, chemotaxis family, response regulator Rcp1
MSLRHAGAPRILLIDDNVGDIRLITEAIRLEAPEAGVTAVTDSTEALSRLKEALEAGCGPQIILLDLRMPKKNGFQVLEEFKSDPATAYLPVVILSSSEADQDVFRSYSLQASSVITKPLGYARLRSAVKTICQYWLEVARLPEVQSAGHEHHEDPTD